MARFVLLYHDCPASYVRASHWDLMLEADGVLRTWAIARLPRVWDDVRAKTVTLCGNCPENSDENQVAAERLTDHRIDYLQLEGPLSGDRGSVRRIDEGTYQVESETAAGCRLRLVGALVVGELLLTDESLQTL